MPQVSSYVIFHNVINKSRYYLLNKLPISAQFVQFVRQSILFNKNSPVTGYSLVSLVTLLVGRLADRHNAGGRI